MDSFSFQGYSASNMVMCMVDGADIYQTDYMGNRKLLGKTQAAYEELEGTTKQYYDKLVELGVIVPPKSQEQMMTEMQNTMMSMSEIIASLSAELKELKTNGHEQCACHDKQDVSPREPKRGGAKSAASDQRDPGQP